MKTSMVLLAGEISSRLSYVPQMWVAQSNSVMMKFRSLRSRSADWWRSPELNANQRAVGCGARLGDVDCAARRRRDGARVPWLCVRAGGWGRPLTSPLIARAR